MTLLARIKQDCTEALKQLYAEQIVHFTDYSIDITPATNSKFGHYQCNSAMKLAKTLSASPREIAEKLRDALLAQDSGSAKIFAAIEVAGPGFINFTLSPTYLTNLLNI